MTFTSRRREGALARTRIEENPPLLSTSNPADNKQNSRPLHSLRRARKGQDEAVDAAILEYLWLTPPIDPLSPDKDPANNLRKI
jgi:hypothetical protein